MLKTYKMTHDGGFAPNPYGGILTLATCKPIIRRCASVGDWIAGFGSNNLDDGGLIYLAKITSKVSFGEYWQNYPQKRPESAPRNNDGERTGDNIYKPKVANPTHCDDFEVIANDFHYENSKNNENCKIDENSHCAESCGGKKSSAKHDLGENLENNFVLICDEFYYFGTNNALDVSHIKIEIPQKQGHRNNEDSSKNCDSEDSYEYYEDSNSVQELIKFVRQNASRCRNYHI